MSKNSQSRNDLTFEIMNGHKIPTDEETLEALSIFRYIQDRTGSPKI